MTFVETKIGYERLRDSMMGWGIKVCCGVTGGGLIHFLKYVEPYVPLRRANDQIDFFTIGEYVAGFIPLGHYLATGEIAAAAATTGAATKLLLCGMTDAKFHNIPAVYLIAATPSNMEFQSPLQDTTPSGMNIVDQIAAELPDGTFVLNNIENLNEQLSAAHRRLKQSKPVVFIMPPNALSEMVPAMPADTYLADICLKERYAAQAPYSPDHPGLTELLQRHLPRKSDGRVVILAGDEAARYPDMPELTSQLCASLKAPIIWSINGANAVSRDNPYACGYLGFGGNDRALELWDSLNDRDLLITIGFCGDEYTGNFDQAKAGLVWNVTSNADFYGSFDGSFRHMVGGAFEQTVGDVREIIQEIILSCRVNPDATGAVSPFYSNLNFSTPGGGPSDAVDIVAFYENLDSMWQPDSLGFDDVCLAYKDRQYVTQRPHPHAKIYSLYRGSAMGGAYGLGLGAKIASPDKHVFVFSGDGCFRLYGGCLAEARQLGITLFVLDNGDYGIVGQGLSKVLPSTPPPRYHAELERIDFGAMARACGWRSFRVANDLSNLSDIMQEAYRPDRPSMLVEVPIDSRQIVGPNPRLRNL